MNQTEKYNLGDRLKQLRLQKRMSQADAGSLLGVDRVTVGKWERNSSIPSSDKIADLARVYSTTTEYILNASKKRKPITLENLDDEEFAVVEAIAEFAAKEIKKLRKEGDTE